MASFRLYMEEYAAHRYDPDLNPTYYNFAVHCGLGIVPARPRKPRDEAKVENAVQVTQRWIVAALRHRKFFSLQALNAAIRELLGKLNLRAHDRCSHVPGVTQDLSERGASGASELDQISERPNAWS